MICLDHAAVGDDSAGTALAVAFDRGVLVDTGAGCERCIGEPEGCLLYTSDAADDYFWV